MKDWQRFVLAHGWYARAHELAAVVGQPVADVQKLRSGTPGRTRFTTNKGFGELFKLWHGRPPRDDEWPRPNRAGVGFGYEWQTPEETLLASLVGRLGAKEISRILTARLRKITGDRRARRTYNSVLVRTRAIGLLVSDLVGGLTTIEAAREIGSRAIIHHCIRTGQLRGRRVGRLWLIPHDVWAKFKASRTFPPKGYVQLSTIRQALGMRSDSKLPEFAKAGYIATAISCNPFGSKGSITRGCWYIDAKVARKLVADRRAGRPMPWHGKPLADNLRVTFRRWQERKHPPACRTCAEIWGEAGAPRTWDDYARRYPPLAHGAKRHLTRVWTPGLTVAEVARYAGSSVATVNRAIENGALTATGQGRARYVSRTDAARWKARRCPTGGNDKSWLSLPTAARLYLFTMAQLRAFIVDGTLLSRVGDFGAAKGIVYVPRQQCAQLREKIGFSEAEAARRVGVSIARLRTLLRGVDWRAAERIPLVTVQAVIKRLESQQGYTIEGAARELKMTPAWIHARILDGTIRVSRAKWDRRRLYISEPMFERLKVAKRHPMKIERWGRDWLLLSDAAHEAGVSTATLVKWAEQGDLAPRSSRLGLRYHRKAVRARARRYWQQVRFHRAVPPSWMPSTAARSRVELVA